MEAVYSLALALQGLAVSRVGPHELEQLRDVEASVELVVELRVGARDFDLFGEGAWQGSARGIPIAYTAGASRRTDVCVDETGHQVTQRELMKVEHVAETAVA